MDASSRSIFGRFTGKVNETSAMNYRHAYHAGNAADVLKHAVVAMILDYLKAKPAPFMVLDAHAGRGDYDLTDVPAQKTGEAAEGIAALSGRPAPHPALAVYLDAVAALNPDGVLRRYPGSPRLAQMLLRPQDRLVCSELHPEEHQALKRAFAGESRVAVHHQDAYAALKAHLPPREKRGLVLLDPPFEQTDEFDRLAAGLALAHRRWPNGVFVLWHPIKERPAVWRFHDALLAAAIPRMLTAELTVHPEDTHLRLNGSGLVIVNPPWRLAETLAEALPALHAALPHDGGGGRVAWLAGENIASQT